MVKYEAMDNWSIEKVGEEYFFCFNNPGLTGENVRLPITKSELDYALQENPNFDQMMELLKNRRML